MGVNVWPICWGGGIVCAICWVGNGDGCVDDVLEGGIGYLWYDGFGCEIYGGGVG